MDLKNLAEKINESITRPGAKAEIVNDVFADGRDCLRLSFSRPAMADEDPDSLHHDIVTFVAVPDEDWWIGVVARETVGVKRVWTGMWARDTIIAVPDLFQAVRLRFGPPEDETPQE